MKKKAKAQPKTIVITVGSCTLTLEQDEKCECPVTTYWTTTAESGVWSVTYRSDAKRWWVVWSSPRCVARYRGEGRTLKTAIKSCLVAVRSSIAYAESRIQKQREHIKACRKVLEGGGMTLDTLIVDWAELEALARIARVFAHTGNAFGYGFIRVWMRGGLSMHTERGLRMVASEIRSEQ